MGSGKTTLFERVKSNSPEVKCIDLDHLLREKLAEGEESLGDAIRRIGWDSFREAENVEFISDTIKRIANTVYKIGGSEEDDIEYGVNFIDQNYYLNIFGNLVPAKTNRPSYHDTSLKFYL